MTYRKHDDGRQGSERNGRARGPAAGATRAMARNGGQERGGAGARRRTLPRHAGLRRLRAAGAPLSQAAQRQAARHAGALRPDPRARGHRARCDSRHGRAGRLGQAARAARVPAQSRHPSSHPVRTAPSAAASSHGEPTTSSRSRTASSRRAGRGPSSPASRARRRELGIPAYDEDACRGILRYAVLRIGWKSDEAMLTVVTAKRDVPRRRSSASACSASIRASSASRRTSTRAAPTRCSEARRASSPARP